MGDAVAVTSSVISGACMCSLVNLRVSQHLENHDVGYPDIQFLFQPQLNAEKPLVILCRIHPLFYLDIRV